MAAVFSAGAMLVRQNYSSAIQEGEMRASAAANVVATNANWMMQASDQALRRIDSALGPDGATSQELRQDIARAVGDLPLGFTYSVFDETGQLRASTAANWLAVNHSDRPYFQRLAKGERLSIARAERETPQDGFAFIVAHRIDRDGVFKGVATITITNASVEKFWSTMGLGDNSTISIIRADGRLLAHHPEPTEPVDLSKTAWYPLLAAADKGIFHSPVSPIDGVSRILSFKKVDGWPIVALAAVDRQEVLAVFWRNLWSELLLVLPLAIATFAGAGLLTWQLHRYSRRNDDLEKANEKNTFLLREVHHRVKNNLQAVMALIRLQPLPPEARADMTSRIQAMVAVHEQIYLTDQYERVDAEPYVRQLVTQIATLYNKPVALEIELEHVLVDRDQALPLGLIVNEVVSNSFKYGLTDDGSGVLRVELKTFDTEIELVIADSGAGFDPVQQRKGMGTKLVTNFAAQLRGRYEYKNESGTIFTLTFPR
ncbi:sensor histidine kinase [Rhizobium sp. Rhizsp42]|uniref:sensor histidine kinase n=1 Tax=Rhizobium sp. Rhizsp42 TaxID=3243034 RepID=UPI0039B0C8E1